MLEYIRRWPEYRVHTWNEDEAQTCRGAVNPGRARIGSDFLPATFSCLLGGLFGRITHHYISCRKGAGWRWAMALNAPEHQDQKWMTYCDYWCVAFYGRSILPNNSALFLCTLSGTRFCPCLWHGLLCLFTSLGVNFADFNLAWH
jgi:hypothetical protein